MPNTHKSIEEYVEEVAHVCSQVEFLHGVPVDLPSDTKALLRGKTREVLRSFAQQQVEEAVEPTIPFLKAFLRTLQSDYSINPVQAVQAIHIPPEQVLRNSADAIDEKRKMQYDLECFLSTLKAKLPTKK